MDIQGLTMDIQDLTPARKENGRYVNNSGVKPHNLGSTLKWFWTRRRSRWPKHVALAPAPEPVSRVNTGIRATLVGHSTVLIQVAGLNLLTDPIWSDRAGPLPGVGPKRVSPPAFDLEALPKIDAILVSHNHYDHLDRRTLSAILARDEPIVLTGLGVGRHIPQKKCVELDWGEGRALGDRVQLTYVPGEHFSARGLFDRNKTLWGGFVIETPSGPIYYAGDTGAGPHFETIRRRFGP